MIKPRIDLLVSSSCNGCNSLIISKISFSSPSTTNEKISKSLETQSLFKLPKSSKNTFYWNLFYHRKKKKLRKFLKRKLLLFIIPQFGGALMKLFVRHATSSHMLNPCSPTKGLQFQKPSNYKQKLALGRSRIQWSNKALHHLSPLQSVCLQRSTATRSKRQKEKKRKKHIRKNKQQQTPSTWRAAHDEHQPQPREILDARKLASLRRSRPQTNRSKCREWTSPSRKRNPNSSNKRKALVDIHPDTPLFSHCRAFSVTLTQSNEDVCSFARWLTPTVSVSRPARPSFLFLRHKSSPTGMRLQSLLCNFLSLLVWNFLALTSSMNLLMPCVRGVCFRNIFLFFSIASVL